MNWLAPLYPFIEITRPVNVAITFLSVFVGAMVSRSAWSPYFMDVCWAAFSAGLIAAGGNVINDYCDRNLDRIEKPKRPLPAGRFSARVAVWWAFICFSAGILASFAVPFPGMVIAITAAVCLVLYSYIWKRQPLIGNLAVAFIASLAFIYGGLAVGKIDVAIWAAMLAFLFHLGREITKDLEDREGDAAMGVQTLVVKYGVLTGRIAATLALVCLAIALTLPYLIGPFRLNYLLISCIGVGPIIAFTLVWVWVKREPEQLHLVNTVQKIGMFIGLIALYAGRPAAEFWQL
ncbi:geranylgeranylglycerol-phosphate geranylgeranyltransferase [bacterium]|nr:geranylgeranylglycerol-phosphate geranylgeranyltransferase [bacterium]MBU1652189.1 geranylgeranylglycerol-phosphate geranylgeranyltransferase [bacterium]MBU1880494.1 geranylgeranylglycerol-phosphate geranylgeranyltransferase [bacterium]